jgi:two-component system response regulator AtoC
VILGTEEAFHLEKPEEKKPFSFAYEVTEDGKIPLKRLAQQVTRRMEHDLILKVLQANHWNRRKSAEVLKISYRALLYKVRQAGLPAKRLQRKIDDAAEATGIGDPSAAQTD